MGITLITGKPGSGKTLYTVNLLIEKLLKEDRPVYASIDGLKFDELGVDRIHPDNISENERIEACRDWSKLPENSIIIIDECQRVFPPRNPMSKAPEYVSLFETHRHHGYDFYLITQAPQLIDRHLHHLIDNHIHLQRTFNSGRSLVREYPDVSLNPAPDMTQDDATKKNFIFPKNIYKYYKSASFHTMKFKLPRKLIWTALAPVLILGYATFSLYTSGGISLFKSNAATDTSIMVVNPEPSAGATLAVPSTPAQPEPSPLPVACRFVVRNQSGTIYDTRDLVTGRKVLIDISRGYSVAGEGENSRIIPAGKSGALCI